jgi:hypothetical protein
MHPCPTVAHQDDDINLTWQDRYPDLLHAFPFPGAVAKSLEYNGNPSDERTDRSRIHFALCM